MNDTLRMAVKCSICNKWIYDWARSILPSTYDEGFGKVSYYKFYCKSCAFKYCPANVILEESESLQNNN